MQIVSMTSKNVSRQRQRKLTTSSIVLAIYTRAVGPPIALLAVCFMYHRSRFRGPIFHGSHRIPYTYDPCNLGSVIYATKCLNHGHSQNGEIVAHIKGRLLILARIPQSELPWHNLRKSVESDHGCRS